jgi:soluble lytic murein transglycosylase-like protein
MMIRGWARVGCCLAAGASLCPAQLDQGTAAVQWSDYYAAAYGLPRELVHSIIEVESGWQPRAVSSKGAAGLMQLMPATAVRFGVTSRFDITQNIRAGVAYLSHLLRLFQGDLRLALAAYAAGEERILSAGLTYSNADVLDYVTRVTTMYRAKRFRRTLQGGTSP